MKFVITEFNFSRCYSYHSDGINIHWSLKGLILRDSMDICEINGTAYAGGSVVPWGELKSGKLKFHDEEIPVSFIKPSNEEQWIQFVQNKSFPQIERLRAYQAYFGEQYINRRLNNSLSTGFFSSVLNTYNAIYLDSNNQEVKEQVLCWEKIYYKFLSEALVNITDEPQFIADIISNIKNLETL